MRYLLSFILILLSFSVFSAEDYYTFQSREEQSRFESLTSELRCLVCQNQTIAESNAPLAGDLRNQVYDLVKRGESNQTIITYLLKRYGNFILYKPPLNLTTSVLWAGPFILLIGGIIFLLLILKSKKRE